MDLFSLTESESAELSYHEEIICGGLQTFVEVGNSLLIIRDKRLYRAEHGTFESYCFEKWGISRRQAYRLIDASETVENLCPMGHISMPINERQVRPLTRLEPEFQQEAWEKAVNTAPNGKVTAEHVQSIVNSYFGDSFDEIDAPRKDILALRFTGDYEWFTPKEYVEKARAVMGWISCDPASNELAQQTVKAETWYDKTRNGLIHEWKGNVFLNPPYSFPEVSHFINKLIQEYLEGNVTQAVLLTNNSADTDWFHLAALKASSICFTRGRISFYKADGVRSAPTNGQTFFYFGENKQGFIENFNDVGLIVEVCG